MDRLRAAAERKDEAFFTRRGLQGARDYLRHALTLSALFYRAGDAHIVTWINPHTRHALPSDLRLALARSLEAIALDAGMRNE